MAATTIGSAYVQILPSTEGISSRLTQALRGPAEIAGGNAGSSFSTGLVNAAKVGAAAVAVASGAVVAFGKESVEAGLSFDATMSQVSAISGAAGKDLDALREMAMEMGASTRFSASEAAEGLTYMAMAGWDTEDMLAGLPGIMSLAAAAGEDLGRTSDIVTDALTAFGMTAADSAHFADVLAAASSSANTNVSMLGESFKYVAPVAGSLGYTAEDTSIALALMANAGIKGSQSGTALRTMLTNLAKPTSDMQVAMDRLGVSLTDADGNMLSLMDIMMQLRSGFGELKISQEDFQESMDDLIEQLEDGTINEGMFEIATAELMERAYGAEGAMKAETAAMLAGKEGMSGLLAIVNSADKDFLDLSEAIYSADGAASQMSETMQDNLQGDLTSMKSAFEGLQIAISNRLTPTLRQLGQFGRDAIRDITEAFNSGGINAAMDTLGEKLGEAISMMSDYIPQIVAAGGQLVSSLASSLLTNADNLTQAAVDLVVQLATDFGDHVDELIPAATDAVLKIAETLLSTDNLDKMLDAALGLMKNLGSGIVKSISEVTSRLPELIDGIVKWLVEDGGAVADIMEAGTELLSQLADDIDGIVDGLTGSITTLVGRVGDELTNTENLGKIAAAGVKMMGSLFSLRMQIETSLAQGVADLITYICDQMGKKDRDIADAGKDLLKNLPSKWGTLDFRMDVERFINRLIERMSEHGQAFYNLGMSLARLTLAGLTFGLSETTGLSDVLFPRIEVPEVPYISVDASNRTTTTSVDNTSMDREISRGEKNFTIISEPGNKTISRYTASDEKAFSGMYAEETVDELKGLRDDMRGIRDDMLGMRVVLDSGEVVGALSGPINNNLGRQYVYDGRGI